MIAETHPRFKEWDSARRRVQIAEDRFRDARIPGTSKAEMEAAEFERNSALATFRLVSENIDRQDAASGRKGEPPPSF
jgi:hypothetical protein